VKQEVLPHSGCARQYVALGCVASNLGHCCWRHWCAVDPDVSRDTPHSASSRQNVEQGGLARTRRTKNGEKAAPQTPGNVGSYP